MIFYDEADYELPEHLQRYKDSLMPHMTKTEITIISVPHEGGMFLKLWSDNK